MTDLTTQTTYWRLGRRSSVLPGETVTIWEQGGGEEDPLGHRDGDRLIGALPREDAERAVAAVNTVAELARFPRRYMTGPPA